MAVLTDLKSGLIPEMQGDTRKRNDTVQVYFDTEKQEFRCFKKLNLETLTFQI